MMCIHEQELDYPIIKKIIILQHLCHESSGLKQWPLHDNIWTVLLLTSLHSPHTSPGGGL